MSISPQSGGFHFSTGGSLPALMLALPNARINTSSPDGELAETGWGTGGFSALIFTII
jgi:hypothetical protein